MPLHRLTSIVIGVPNVEETGAYYREFGLTPVDGGWFETRDGGRQLRIVEAPTRRLIQLSVGADDDDDLARAESNLRALGYDAQKTDGQLSAVDKATELRVTLQIGPRFAEPRVEPTAYNGPGRLERVGGRAPGVMRAEPVRPTRLGHAVMGSVDYKQSMRLLVDGLGFQVSDHIKGEGSFLRCSTDHHNVLLLRSPVNFLHHTAWQVNDIDDIGRGAFAMLEDHPERHVWGPGRHFAGSNFFWYLKDPAGNFSEYYSDMDCIPEQQLWMPEDLEGAKGLFSWGPPPPPSFIHPEDLAAHMTGAHAAR